MVISQGESTRIGEGRYLCECSCGRRRLVRSHLLVSGATRGCGCGSRPREAKHGLCFTPAYKAWANMKDRCLNPRSLAFPSYGGRGIVVCERWLSFENFLSDMGERPEGLSIERKDNNKGYFKENCKWATRSEQQKNKRRFNQYDGWRLGTENEKLKVA